MQTKIMREWVQKRQKNKEIFVILGDFNRQLEVVRDNNPDLMWLSLTGRDSRTTKGDIEFARHPDEAIAKRWGKNNSRRMAIDYIVIPIRSSKELRPRNFTNYRYREVLGLGRYYGNLDYHNLSNHCAYSVHIDF